MEKVIAYKAFNGRLFDTEEKCLAYEKKMSQYPKVKESVDKAASFYIIDSVKGDSNNIRKHFTSYMVDGKVFTKEKIGYSSDKEAIEMARVMNCREHTIHKLVAYKCPVCQKWHIGRSRKVLTEKEREHYMKVGFINNI